MFTKQVFAALGIGTVVGAGAASGGWWWRRRKDKQQLEEQGKAQDAVRNRLESYDKHLTELREDSKISKTEMVGATRQILSEAQSMLGGKKDDKKDEKKPEEKK
jgi:hypothetical protein